MGRQDPTLASAQDRVVSFARWTYAELADAHDEGRDVYLATELAGAAAHVAIDLSEARALGPGTERDALLERARRSAMKVHRITAIRGDERAIDAAIIAEMIMGLRGHKEA